eukprot:11452562-Ditylum_brightwellii.AAC.1
MVGVLDIGDASRYESMTYTLHLEWCGENSKYGSKCEQSAFISALDSVSPSVDDRLQASSSLHLMSALLLCNVSSSSLIRLLLRAESD